MYVVKRSFDPQTGEYTSEAEVATELWERAVLVDAVSSQTLINASGNRFDGNECFYAQLKRVAKPGLPLGDPEASILLTGDLLHVIHLVNRLQLLFSVGVYGVAFPDGFSLSSENAPEELKPLLADVVDAEKIYRVSSVVVWTTNTRDNVETPPLQGSKWTDRVLTPKNAEMIGGFLRGLSGV